MTDLHLSSVSASQCVLGYCVAPLLLASIVSFFLHSIYIRIPVSLASVGWAVWGQSHVPILNRAPFHPPPADPLLCFSVAASVNFMSGTRLPSSRQSLAVYPLFLFYFIRQSPPPICSLCLLRTRLTSSPILSIQWPG